MHPDLPLHGLFLAPSPLQKDRVEQSSASPNPVSHCCGNLASKTNQVLQKLPSSSSQELYPSSPRIFLSFIDKSR